ncbi:MAG TPA: PAAR domain-containing protein [Acidobacteriaceae bacterium]
MGMPACRIGDLTEHGGTIILGFPTVLIGDMPASRIGDMHVCPMITPGVPPIPHVGGPFILGSPTVLVGFMPQSRVTDTLVCVGPPDQAVLGCETVLVGMAGGAGAAGAAAGAAAAGGAPAAAAAAAGASDAANSTPPTPKLSVATQQADGSVQTAATGPAALPPITLKQPGWPDLPPENTATFQSVQPATVLPGTQLYAPGDADASGQNSYWSTAPPDPSTTNSTSADPNPPDPSADPGSSSAAPSGADSSATAPEPSSSSPSSSSDAAPAPAPAATHVQVLTVSSAAGLKAWAGQPAAAAGPAPMQVWTPAAVAQAAGSTQVYRLSGGGR